VGTRPEGRGRGLASTLITAVTDRCDAEGVPAYLESSDPANVPLYERHGFSVTGEVTIVDGPTIPLMWRDPQS
jgi:predicted GNAT family acetyltransferase